MKKCVAAVVILLMGTSLGLSIQKSGEWIRYRSAAGRYTVWLPSQPSVGMQESATADGIRFVQYKATVVEGSAVFLTAYFDHVPGTIFSLDKARDGMVGAVKGTVLGESIISLGGSPGRELKVATKDEEGIEYLLRSRLYDIGKRVYILQFIFPKSLDSQAMTAEGSKYFDSFQVSKN